MRLNGVRVWRVLGRRRKSIARTAIALVAASANRLEARQARPAPAPSAFARNVDVRTTSVLVDFGDLLLLAA